MCSRSELRARARKSLGGSLFSDKWLMMLLVSLIGELLLGALSFTFVGPLIIAGPVAVGVAFFARRLAREEVADIGETFRFVGNHFVGALLVGLLQWLYTLLWTLLFIIPGIIKAISYSMASHIRIDHPDWSADACITESRRLMNGHKMEYFLLMLSFIGWWIVGALCLGIGTLWVAAYVNATDAHFYEELVKNDIHVEPAPAAEPQA